MKLQKLVYYCQAWSLVWDGQALFEDPVEAWANGPVVDTLYLEHKGQFMVTSWPRGKPENLSTSERETIDAVIDTYAKFTPAQLSELTHREDPWRNARGDLAAGESSRAVITHAAMAKYYENIHSDPCPSDVDREKLSSRDEETMERPRDIRVLLKHEGGWWTAVCLDYFIAAQARERSQIEDAFSQAFLAHVFHAKSKGKKPFESLRPAPAKYHDDYKRGEPMADLSITDDPTRPRRALLRSLS